MYKGSKQRVSTARRRRRRRPRTHDAACPQAAGEMAMEDNKFDFWSFLFVFLACVLPLNLLSSLIFILPFFRSQSVGNKYDIQQSKNTVTKYIDRVEGITNKSLRKNRRRWVGSAAANAASDAAGAAGWQAAAAAVAA